MKLRKLFSIACAAIMTLGMGTGIVTASAADTYDGPDFFNDFQNYTTSDDAAYDPMQLAGEWGNGWFDGVGDGTLDSACDPGENYRDWAIKADPKDPTNKALYINCIPTTGSFVYFSLKDENSELISTKNFEFSFDFLLVQGDANGGWLGAAIHKTADTRFNGCNNIMMTTRFWPSATTSISSMIMRNLGMSGINVEPMNEDRSGVAANFACPDGETIYSQWYTFKLVANGTQFDTYINGVHFGGAEITKNPAKKFGYVSIVTCMTEVYIDNVRLVNNDTEAPPVAEDPVDPPVVTLEAPALTGENAYAVDVNTTAALEIGVDTKGQVITKVEKDGTLIDSKYYTYENGKLTLNSLYITNLAKNAGTHTFTVTTAGGSVSFTLTVNAAETSSSQGGGCGATVSGLGVVSMLTMLGAVVAVRKRK